MPDAVLSGGEDGGGRYAVVPQYLTKRQVAELAGVSERTVETWITEAGLRSIKIGKVRRIAPADFTAFMAAHAVGGDR